MQTFKIAVLVALFAAIPTRAALAADMEEEVDKWVITPCYQLTAATRVVNLNEAEAADLSIELIAETAIANNPETGIKIKKALLPLQDESWEIRRLVYKRALAECMVNCSRSEKIAANVA